MIYLDNASTTKPYKECLDEFNKINLENFYNPSAMYEPSFNLSLRINDARQEILKIIGGEREDKIIFTSGATESNNLAIFGSALNKKMKYLFSCGEHPSVYNCAKNLLQMGYDVDFIPMQRNGEIDYEKFEKMIDDNVYFVSIMFVNNETGAINDLKRVREIIDKVNPSIIFHVDGVQGFCKIPLNVSSCKIDLLSISSHKIGGIKGVGALYISKRTNIKNINYGGGQEFSLRSGTVNVAGILSFLKSCQISNLNMKSNYENALVIKNHLLEFLKTKSDKVKIVSSSSSSPFILSLIFKDIRGETVMRMLDNRGIIVGTGSACSSNKVGNRVLENMGYTKKEVIGAVRISFFENKVEEVDDLIVALKTILQ